MDTKKINLPIVGIINEQNGSLQETLLIMPTLKIGKFIFVPLLMDTKKINLPIVGIINEQNGSLQETLLIMPTLKIGKFIFVPLLMKNPFYKLI